MPAQNYRIEMDPRQVAALLRGPDGPVHRHLLKLAEQVQDEAKRRVGYSANAESGHRHLRDTIVKRISQSAGGIQVEVGTEEPHAIFHHEGTPRHWIYPRTAKVLAFDIGGVTVFASRVDHPGTRPNRFLADALVDVMRRL